MIRPWFAGLKSIDMAVKPGPSVKTASISCFILLTSTEVSLGALSLVLLQPVKTETVNIIAANRPADFLIL